MESLEDAFRRWMQLHKNEYLDSRTNEVNMTELAEAAAINFNISNDGEDIPEWVFDLSFEVSLK